MNPKSLRWHLVLSLIFSLILMCVLSNAIVYTYIKNLELQSFDDALTKRLQTLAAATLAASDGSVQMYLNDFELGDYQPSHDESYFALRSFDKKVILRSPSLRMKNIPILHEDSGEVVFKDILLPDGRNGRAASIHFVPGNAEGSQGGEVEPASSADTVFLTVAISRERLDYLNRVEMSFALLVGLFLVVGAVVIVWITVGRSFQKFGRFSDQVKTINYNNLSERLSGEELPSEMIPFKDQFNQLLARVEAGVSREKRYNANVSHELRTPISELRLLNEVALMETSSNGDGEPYRDFFEDSLELALKMEHLVDAISALNRCDSERQKVHRSVFDVRESILLTWADWKGKAEGRGLNCVFEVTTPSRITSDKNLFEAVLANLFSNVVTYAETSSNFHCQLTESGTGFTIVMTNGADELSPADLTHLTEPFWQKEDSRSNPAHAGLGWSLIASYCRILKIQWFVDLPSKKVFRVRLSIPPVMEPPHEWEGLEGEHGQ